MKKTVYIAIAAASWLPALHVACGAVKPLAVWNGEFSASPMIRNGVTINRGGSSFTGQHFQIAGDKSGASITWQSKISLSHTVIANIKNIRLESGDSGVLFSFYSKDSGSSPDGDKYWLELDGSGCLNANMKGYAITNINSPETPSFSDLRSFAFHVSPGGGMDSYAFADGTIANSNNIFRLESVNGLQIGGRNETKNDNISGALVTYVAVFTNDVALTEDDMRTWSLYGMERAETATNTVKAAANFPGDAIIKGGGEVGVNLNGGVFKVSGATTAHAIFVQEDSTLEFSAASSSLDATGPVYIATGRTLKLRPGDDSKEFRLSASLFADSSQITVETDENWTITRTDTSIVAKKRNIAPLYNADGSIAGRIEDGTAFISSPNMVSDISSCENVEKIYLSNIIGDYEIKGAAALPISVFASDDNGDSLHLDITGSFSIGHDDAGTAIIAFLPSKPQFSDVTVDNEDILPLKKEGETMVFGVKTVPGLWYMAAYAENISDLDTSERMETSPFIAEASETKIEVHGCTKNEMFYKILVAPSKAAFSTAK